MDPWNNKPNYGNTRSINVVGITGKGNVIRNVKNIEITGVKSTQGASYNLNESVNVAGISGEGQQIDNIDGIRLCGADLTQPLLASKSRLAAGPDKERQVYKVNGKSYEVLEKIGESGSCQVYDCQSRDNCHFDYISCFIGISSGRFYRRKALCVENY